MFSQSHTQTMEGSLSVFTVFCNHRYVLYQQSTCLPSLLSTVFATTSFSKVSCICCPRKHIKCSFSMRSLSSSSMGVQVPSINHCPLITGMWSCSVETKRHLNIYFHHEFTTEKICRREKKSLENHLYTLRIRVKVRLTLPYSVLCTYIHFSSIESKIIKAGNNITACSVTLS